MNNEKSHVFVYIFVDKSVAQVSLRWLLQKPVVTSVVFGAKNLDQLEENMGASTGWELTQDQVIQVKVLFH